MPDGGALTVELDHDDREILVRVGDTGKGIPEDHLSKIFDPFFTTKSKGSGLGLSVVLRIVKTYKGKIAVERGNGVGTVFTIRLPMAMQ
jgi:signal transduction histidine kinase